MDFNSIVRFSSASTRHRFVKRCVSVSFLNDKKRNSQIRPPRNAKKLVGRYSTTFVDHPITRDSDFVTRLEEAEFGMVFLLSPFRNPLPHICHLNPLGGGSFVLCLVDAPEDNSINKHE